VRKAAILVRMPESLKARAEEAASNLDQPTAHLIVQALEAALRERDVLDRLLEDPSYRTIALLWLINFDREGRAAARARGLPEKPEAWMRDSDCFRIACAGVMAACGISTGTARGKSTAQARSA